MNQRIINRYKSAIAQAQRLHSDYQRRANRVYNTYGIVIPQSTYPQKIESMCNRLASLKITAEQ